MKINSMLFLRSSFLTFVLLLSIALFALSAFGHVDKGLSFVIFVLLIYISFRPKYFLHPAHIVFANYLIYMVMPYCIYLVYHYFEIEYLLPWGKINDWSTVSTSAYIHYAFLFTLLFSIFSALLGTKQFEENNLTISYLSDHIGWRGSLLWVIISSVFALSFLFIQQSGGISAWATDYSNTYLNNKAGLGVLNIFLIWIAHFIAFVFGYIRFILKAKVGLPLLAVGIFVLFVCMYIQGFKSRLPLLLFFYLAPLLISRELKLFRAGLLFLLLISMFLIGMFFRSEGFYNTPRLGVEYLMSYFNTIFLHDIIINDYAPGEVLSMFMSFNKLQELVGVFVPREQYDLAVFLTQKYFPDDWFVGGATQQWPLETDLYLSMPSPIFWVIPVLGYCSIMILIFHQIKRGSGFMLFVYSAELVRIMSIFRSGFLTWDIWPNLVMYLIGFMLWSRIFYRKNLHRPPSTIHVSPST